MKTELIIEARIPSSKLIHGMMFKGPVRGPYEEFHTYLEAGAHRLALADPQWSDEPVDRLISHMPDDDIEVTILCTSQNVALLCYATGLKFSEDWPVIVERYLRQSPSS